MDIRYVAWAGYQFDYTAVSGVIDYLGTACPPDIISEETGEININTSETSATLIIDADTNNESVNITGMDIKPKLVAFPSPTV